MDIEKTQMENSYNIYVSLDHKTSHKGTFFDIEIYASSESWINQLSIYAWSKKSKYWENRL